MSMIIILWILWTIGAIGAAALVYDLVWGPDKRYFRSRAYCYRNSESRVMVDAEFFESGGFAEKRIPEQYVLAKRIEIADCLDYPPDRLHPEMNWEQIPLERSTFWDRADDELVDYIKALDQDPQEFLSGRSIKEIISDLYHLEQAITWHNLREHPVGWEREITKFKREIKQGKRQKDSLHGQSVASVIMDLYRMRISARKDVFQ